MRQTLPGAKPCGIGCSSSRGAGVPGLFPLALPYTSPWRGATRLPRAALPGQGGVPFPKAPGRLSFTA